MKTFFMSLGLAALAATSVSGMAATSVGVSIGIDQPGYYGRVDIGRVAIPPLLVYPQPVVIVPTPVVQYQSPIYLYVPPGHAGNWRKHCGYYGACNRPVYFVNEGWYRDHYRGHGWKQPKGHGKGGKHGRHD